MSDFRESSNCGQRLQSALTGVCGAFSFIEVCNGISWVKHRQRRNPQKKKICSWATWSDSGGEFATHRIGAENSSIIQLKYILEMSCCKSPPFSLIPLDLCNL